MHVRGGYLYLGRLRGAPIRVHWSAAIGAIVFTHSLSPGAWLGFFLIILLHECGHAWVVNHYGLQVVGIDVNACGGQCAWAGNPTAIERATVAWGGVVAQFIVFIVASILALIVNAPGGSFYYELFSELTATNLVIAALNLIPIPPLDGAEAWPLFKLLWRRRQREKQQAKMDEIEDELEQLRKTDEEDEDVILDNARRVIRTTKRKRDDDSEE